MKHRENHFTGARGLSIYGQCWEPETTPRALVLIVHGAGEHSARYHRLADYLTCAGYVVAALDHPHHGRSEGRYGHLERLDDCLQTLEIFQRQVQAEYPALPQFLLGHSMGGLISSLHLLDHQSAFVGAVLSGPAIKTGIEPPWLQRQLIRLLSALFPAMGVLQLDAGGVSRDPREVEKYVSDPLVNHGKMSARMVSELFAGMQRIQSQASGITLPIMILHGGADPMTSPEGSRFLYDAVSSRDKTLKIYPGLYHEIFNEPEREEIFAEVLAWCDRHLPG